MLGRSSADLVTTKRSGIVDGEQKLSFSVRTTDSRRQEEANRLSTGTAAWKVTRECSEFEVLLDQAAQLTKVRLTFAAEGVPWEPDFTNMRWIHLKPTQTTEQPARVKTWLFGPPPTYTLDRLPEYLRVPKFTMKPRVLPKKIETMAKLERVEFFGKLGARFHASQFVNRHFADLSIATTSEHEVPVAKV